MRNPFGGDFVIYVARVNSHTQAAPTTTNFRSIFRGFRTPCQRRKVKSAEKRICGDVTLPRRRRKIRCCCWCRSGYACLEKTACQELIAKIPAKCKSVKNLKFFIM